MGFCTVVHIYREYSSGPECEVGGEVGAEPDWLRADKSSGDELSR